MMLPLAVVAKRVKKCKLIYDPHELETERLGLYGFGKKISKWIERKFIFSSDAIIVVSESILKWYTASYQLSNIFLIRNVPHFFQSKKSNVLREKFVIPNHQLIFIYQGLINEGRSIELYLRAFSKMDHHHLVIMGYGPLEHLVIEYAGKFPNIHFQPAVKPSEVMDYTSSADIGLSLIENCCLSYYYSLPNKFFEYIMAEIPLVVSNFPDMADIVKLHDIGWPVDITEEHLVDTITSISEEQIGVKIGNLNKVKSQFTWENEESTLVKVFEKLT
jgi:glycosyltransferase involved in cell wall biosynthesis